MMDQFARMLIRMSYWVQNPPPRRHLVAMAIAIGLCFAVVAIEWAGWWPDALKRERLPGSTRLMRPG